MTTHRNSGFSLLEVMCAILILGIAMTGLTMGVTTALSSNKESELQTAAALLAAGQIEMIRANGLLTDGDTEGQCEGLPLYKWKQSINSTSPEGLHDVKVTIESSASGKAIFELHTQLFDPPNEPASGQLSDQKRPNLKRNERNKR